MHRYFVPGFYWGIYGEEKIHHSIQDSGMPIYRYGRFLLHVTKPYLRVNFFWIDTFGSRRHKIISEEFNISGKTLVRP